MIVTFLTDYGLADPFVGICHAVILRHAPDARIVDLTHAVPPQDVERGALVLLDALPHLPPAVHLAVVDPTVGTDRRAVAVRAGDHHLVGPDNGLLWPALQSLGGATAAVALRRPGDTAARTFDGRDVFAPAAGRLAAGTPLEALGDPVDPATLVTLDLPGTTEEEDGLHCHVLATDAFGNLQLSARPEDLPVTPPADVLVDGRTVPYRRTFADVPTGMLVLLADAFGRLQLAVRDGDAARALWRSPGDPVVLAPAAPRTIS